MDRRTTDYLRLLEAYDDPVGCEAPLDFDRHVAERRFCDFAHALEQALAAPCIAETGVFIQDATFHGQVVLPPAILRTPAPVDDPVSLRVSNWGNMATINNVQLIQPEMREVIQQLLNQFGYVFIPPHVLDLPYTGRNQGVDGIATWWIRYFDYV